MVVPKQNKKSKEEIHICLYSSNNNQTNLVENDTCDAHDKKCHL